MGGIGGRHSRGKDAMTSQKMSLERVRVRDGVGKRDKTNKKQQQRNKEENCLDRLTQELTPHLWCRLCVDVEPTLYPKP